MIFLMQIFGLSGIDEAMLKISQADDLRSVYNEMDYLYKNLQNKLFRYFRKIFRKFIPPQTIEDLEDGYSNGWERILIKRKTYDPNRKEGALNWIKVVIGNTIRNIFSAKYKFDKKHPKLLLPVYLDDDDNKMPSFIEINAIDKKNTAVKNLYQNEVQELFNYFLEHDKYVCKDPNIRKVLEQVLINNRKKSEIANDLEIANSTVTKYYHLSLFRLKEFMKVNGWNGWED